MNRTLKTDCRKFSKEIGPDGKRILLATLPAGSIVDVQFDKANPMLMTIVSGDFSCVCRSANWNKYFKKNPKPPSVSTLMRWQFDGICKSLAGNTVEPDGWSFDGTPSWMLAMGLI